MIDVVKLGSNTAKGGFKNEADIVSRFNNWENDDLAKDWLVEMNYKIEKIEYVKAEKIKGSYKADIQVWIKLKQLIDIQNLQIKLASSPQGFNQIDKRWIDKYAELWNMPEDIKILLKHFTGEFAPTIIIPRDPRRMFVDELKKGEQENLIKFFKENKTLIISDILKGRGKFATEWMLVILKIKDKKIKWALKAINFVLNFYGNEEVKITKQGSIKIGKITIQRKGGDKGRNTAKMLQFKINPFF